MASLVTRSLTGGVARSRRIILASSRVPILRSTSTRAFSNAAVATHTTEAQTNITSTDGYVNAAASESTETVAQQTDEPTQQQEQRSPTKSKSNFADVDDPNLQCIHITNSFELSRKVGSILAGRMQKRYPTLMDAMGTEAICNAANTFINANKNMRARVALDLSEHDRRKIADYFLGKVQGENLAREDGAASESMSLDNPDYWKIEVDLRIDGLEIGMRLDSIVEPAAPLTREERSQRNQEIREARGVDSNAQTPAELKALLETPESGKTRFLFKKSTDERIAFIPSYVRKENGAIGMRFEPLMVTGDTVSPDDGHWARDGSTYSEPLLPHTVVYSTTNKEKLTNCAETLQRKWTAFCRYSNKQQAGQATDRASSPKVVAMGREAVANAVKMIAIANEATKAGGGKEFCALPSFHFMKDKRPGMEGKDLVQMKFEFFGL